MRDSTKIIGGPAKAGAYVLALVAAIAISLPASAQNAAWDAKYRDKGPDGQYRIKP